MTLSSILQSKYIPNKNFIVPEYRIKINGIDTIEYIDKGFENVTTYAKTTDIDLGMFRHSNYFTNTAEDKYSDMVIGDVLKDKIIVFTGVNSVNTSSQSQIAILIFDANTMYMLKRIDVPVKTSFHNGFKAFKSNQKSEEEFFFLLEDTQKFKQYFRLDLNDLTVTEVSFIINNLPYTNFATGFYTENPEGVFNYQSNYTDTDMFNMKISYYNMPYILNPIKVDGKYYAFLKQDTYINAYSQKRYFFITSDDGYIWNIAGTLNKQIIDSTFGITIKTDKINNIFIQENAPFPTNEVVLFIATDNSNGIGGNIIYWKYNTRSKELTMEQQPTSSSSPTLSSITKKEYLIYQDKIRNISLDTLSNSIYKSVYLSDTFGTSLKLINYHNKLINYTYFSTIGAKSETFATITSEDWQFFYNKSSECIEIMYLSGDTVNKKYGFSTAKLLTKEEIIKNEIMKGYKVVKTNVRKSIVDSGILQGFEISYGDDLFSQSATVNFIIPPNKRFLYKTVNNASQYYLLQRNYPIEIYIKYNFLDGTSHEVLAFKGKISSEPEITDLFQGKVTIQCDTGYNYLNDKDFKNFKLPSTQLHTAIKTIFNKAGISDTLLTLPTTSPTIPATVYTNDNSLIDYLDLLLENFPTWRLFRDSNGKFVLKEIKASNKVVYDLNTYHFTSLTQGGNPEFFNKIIFEGEDIVKVPRVNKKTGDTKFITKNITRRATASSSGSITKYGPYQKTIKTFLYSSQEQLNSAANKALDYYVKKRISIDGEIVIPLIINCADIITILDESNSLGYDRTILWEVRNSTISVSKDSMTTSVTLSSLNL